LRAERRFVEGIAPPLLWAVPVREECEGSRVRAKGGSSEDGRRVLGALRDRCSGLAAGIDSRGAETRQCASAACFTRFPLAYPQRTPQRTTQRTAASGPGPDPTKMDPRVIRLLVLSHSRECHAWAPASDVRVDHPAVAGMLVLVNGRCVAARSRGRDDGGDRGEPVA